MPFGLPTLQPFQTAAVELAAGQQIDFAITPSETRTFRVETKGASDTLLVLVENVNGEPRMLAGDDDSGEDRNAAIVLRLFSVGNYIARLRLYYPGRSGKTGVASNVGRGMRAS